MKGDPYLQPNDTYAAKTIGPFYHHSLAKAASRLKCEYVIKSKAFS